MLRRSYLYVPGNRADLLGKAHRAGADALVIDFEDAVPPAEKTHAREIAVEALKTMETIRNLPIYLRLNAGTMAFEDLAALSSCKICGVRLAKAEDANLVRELAAALDTAEMVSGAMPSSIEIQPIVESVRGLFAMEEMAAASARIRSFVFGAGDFVTDIGGDATANRIETLYARSLMVLRSRQLAIDPPIAHVFTPINDVDGLKRVCMEDRALGFYGRSCIHPAQVSIINQSFTVPAARSAHARKVINAHREAQQEGRGTQVLDDGTFVDEAVAKGARRLLAGDSPDE